MRSVGLLSRRKLFFHTAFHIPIAIRASGASATTIQLASDRCNR